MPFWSSCQKYEPEFDCEETSDKPQRRDILQSEGPVLFKREGHERQRIMLVWKKLD